MQLTAPNCRTCGACCVEPLDDGYGIADCSVADVKRMSCAVRAKLHVNGSEGWRSTPATFYEDVGKVCDFLRGTPGQRTSCGIYATRPDVCRKFEPGSRRCIAARDRLGL